MLCIARHHSVDPRSLTKHQTVSSEMPAQKGASTESVLSSDSMSETIRVRYVIPGPACEP